MLKNRPNRQFLGPRLPSDSQDLPRIYSSHLTQLLLDIARATFDVFQLLALKTIFACRPVP